MTELKKHIHREITPLKKEDCFLVIDRKRKLFNYPIHFHPEYELNYIYNAKGGRRIIGDHIGEIEQRELVLIGPNLYHGWENHQNDKAKDFHEVTIQFAGDVFDHNLFFRSDIYLINFCSITIEFKSIFNSYPIIFFIISIMIRC